MDSDEKWSRDRVMLKSVRAVRLDGGSEATAVGG